MHAHSPQAKGRVERLCGSFMDRLIKELRLAGMRTVAHSGQLYQIETPVRTAQVPVEARLDGTLRMTHHGQALAYRLIAARPVRPAEPATIPTVQCGGSRGRGIIPGENGCCLPEKHR